MGYTKVRRIQKFLRDGHKKINYILFLFHDQNIPRKKIDGVKKLRHLKAYQE